MGFVLSSRGDIIDFLGSEGRKDCREGDDEARCIKGIFLEAGIKEDRTREHRWRIRDGRVAEGEDQDPLPGRDRECAEVSGGRVVATSEADRPIGGGLQTVDDLEVQLAYVNLETGEAFVVF